MPIKDAVELVVAVAMAHWGAGDCPQGLESDTWMVGRTEIEGSDDATCIVLGRGADTRWVQANVDVHAKGHVVPDATADQRELGEILRGLPSVKSTLIKYAHCSLYAPAGKAAESWARAQVGLWFLQRAWVHSEDDEAWVWTNCLCPVIQMIPAGRRALEDAELGYELQLAFLRNYINPLRPGGFQSYVRSTIRRVATRRSKSQHAESRDPLDLENPFKSEAFGAFLRQRKRRGDPGIGSYKGRLVPASRDVLERLQVEYIHIIANKRFVKDAASMMERYGAESESAKRQVRRWLRGEGGPEGAKARLNDWIQKHGAIAADTT